MYYLEQSPQIQNELNQAVESSLKFETKPLLVLADSSKLTVVSHLGANIIVRQVSTVSGAEQVLQAATDAFNQTVVFAFFESGDAFVLTMSPLKVYFISQEGKLMIELTLAESINLDEPIFTVHEQLVYIFGWCNNKKKNLLFELNLQTLGIKTIDTTKGYGPGSRTGYGAIFCEGRLYMFGGVNTKGEPCQKLNWVYDLEKGSWFGLQMAYPEEVSLRPRLSSWDSGKVVIFGQGSHKVWVYELHQSTIKEVRGSDKLSAGRLFNLGCQLFTMEDDNFVRLGLKIGHQKKSRKN